MDDARSLLLVSVLAGAGAVACSRGGTIEGGNAAPANDAATTGTPDVWATIGGGANQDAPTSVDLALEAGPLDKTIVLAIAPADGLPLDGVASLIVTVMENGAAHKQTFPHDPAKAIADVGAFEIAVVVPPSESGMVTFVVDARNAAGCALATGLTNVVLVLDATIHAGVSLQRLDACAAGDGGASDAVATEGGARFPGCDPAALTCGDGMTCEISCGPRTAVCAAAGDAFPGTMCATSADCAPGTQCVGDAAGRCATKVCRRFCDEDVNCPQPVQAALPRNVCAVPLSCGGVASPYRTCSVSCDPTYRAALDGDTSCPGDLSCVPLDADHADCACAAATQTKTEGQACAVSDDCVPGFVCHLEGAARACRALCRCSVEDGACAAFVENACPSAAMHCAPLEGGTVYGVCVP